MKNRLQIRYHMPEAFPYKRENALTAIEKIKKSSLVSEPLVAFYGENPKECNAIIAIGRNGNGTDSSDNALYFTIDTAKLEEDIKEIQIDSDKYDELLNKVYETVGTILEDVKSIQSELDTTQVNAGLETDGTYSKVTEGKYISLASTIKDAIIALDTALKNEETERAKEFNNLQTDANSIKKGAGLKEDGSYNTVESLKTNYLKSSDSLFSAEIALDKELKSVSVKLDEKANLTENIRKSAGFDSDGKYVEYKENETNYLEASKTLQGADAKLDSIIGNIVKSTGLNPKDGSYVPCSSEKHHHICEAKTLHEADMKLDSAISDVETKIGNSADGITEDTVYGKINAETDRAEKEETIIKSYNVNGKKISESPILNGADINLDGYVKSEGLGKLNVKPTDTVNEAIGKLDKSIDNETARAESEEKKSRTEVKVNEPDKKYFDFSVSTDASDSHNIYTLGVKDIVSKEELAEVSDAVIAEKTRAEGVEGGHETRIETVEHAIDGLNGTIEKNKIKSENKSINIDTLSGPNTDLSVHVDDSTIHINQQGALYVDKKALTQYQGKDSITVSEEKDGVKTVSLTISPSDNVLTDTSDGLKSDITLEWPNDGKNKIYLKGKNGAILSEVDVAEFLKDGMLESVSFDSSKKILTFVFNTDSGKTSIPVDLTSLIDTYTASNGIKLVKTEGKSDFVGVVSDKSETFLKVDESGFFAEGIKKAIDDADEKNLQASKDFTTGITTPLSEKVKTIEETYPLNIEANKLAIEKLNGTTDPTSVDIKVKNAVSLIKGGASTEYDNLSKLENKIKETNTSLVSLKDGQVKSNTDAIAELNGDGDTSVNKKISSALNPVLTDLEKLKGPKETEGSVKSMIFNSSIGKVDTSIDPTQAESQTLMHKFVVDGQPYFYASNSANEIMLNGDLFGSSSVQSEMTKLKNTVDSLDASSGGQASAIAELKTRMSELEKKYEQLLVEISTIKEKQITTIKGETNQISARIDTSEPNTVYIGFAEDAIFSSGKYE